MVKMIKLEEETYRELSSLGNFKETYDDIVKRLVAAYKEEKKK